MNATLELINISGFRTAQEKPLIAADNTGLTCPATGRCSMCAITSSTLAFGPQTLQTHFSSTLAVVANYK